MSNTKFVVSHMDEQMGPFDEQELKNKWSKGEILPIDYVYDEAVQDWVLLAERFAWAKAEEVAPPPPMRTDSVVSRRATATLTSNTPVPPPAKTDPAIKLEKTDPVIRLEKPVRAEPPPKPEPVLETVSAKAEPKAATPDFKLETVVPAPAKKTAAQPAKVKLVDGQGEIDLSPLHPGKVELVLQDSSAMLKMQEPHRIQVKPAEPVEVVWSIANQQVVGQDLEIWIKALDEHGNVCLHYTDQFVIQVRGPSPRDITLTTQDGQANLKISHTKAEMWSLTLHYSGTKHLRLPENRTLEWQAGPAARLVLDGPHEYIAGVPLKVQVKAVDTFGNVAKNFQGTVVLEVKAS